MATSDRRVIIARHGETTWSAEGKFTGHLDPPLSALGHRQALALSRALRPEPLTTIVSSPLVRAVQTAREVAWAHGLPHTLDDRLVEEDLGPWQGLTRHEVSRARPEAFARWSAGEVDPFDGREGLAAVAARAAPAVRSALASVPPHQALLLVTHSNTALALLSHLLREPLRESLLRPGLPPGGFWILTGGHGHWSIDGQEGARSGADLDESRLGNHDRSGIGERAGHRADQAVPDRADVGRSAR
ncbi:histidine phosphatase family protein [Cryptosporangium arvum]|uniref:histidine phosphatase family protein n=1 Tax=Cryptosporangium arvum TaxID=80871 RepID=UPI0004B9E29E|nr:histidine phosphatase family protein [Cryptosporangium arvum]